MSLSIFQVKIKFMKNMTMEDIYIFFIVDTNHGRPPTDGFINQRVLSIENAQNVYKAFRDNHIVDSSCMTLCP